MKINGHCTNVDRKKGSAQDFFIRTMPDQFLLFKDHKSTGYLKIIVPRLRGYCGGVVDSIISIFTQLHRSGFNLEFETMFESLLIYCRERAR